MTIEIHIVDWLTHQQAISTIRHCVFIKEQGVPETEEWDGLDEIATTIHVMASDNNKPVGTARLLHSGQIGRMCVLKEYRHQKIGGRLLTALIDYADLNRFPSVFLNSQVPVIPFYNHFGFEAEGAVFNDAGIPHRRMNFLKK